MCEAEENNRIDDTVREEALCASSTVVHDSATEAWNVNVRGVRRLERHYLFIRSAELFSHETR